MDLADHVKFLRAKYHDGGDTLKTINQLVELVAEMQNYIDDISGQSYTKADALLTALKE
jgi:sensor histidine kinase regulating citrate/malate metabolism